MHGISLLRLRLSRKVQVSMFALAIMLVSAVSAFAQTFPTAEPITGPTVTESIGGTVSVIQMFGLVGFIFAALFLLFGPRVFRRLTGGGR